MQHFALFYNLQLKITLILMAQKGFIFFRQQQGLLRTRTVHYIHTFMFFSFIFQAEGFAHIPLTNQRHKNLLRGRL